MSTNPPSNPELAFSQPFPRVRSLSENAYNYLKTAILRGELAPGTQLKERALAEQLKISPTPLREAMARLEQDNLVESIPYQGTFVTGFTLEDIFEIYEVRKMLEGQAAAQAALNISAGTLARMEQLLTFMSEEIDKGNYSTYDKNDHEFHGLIAASTNNRWLVRAADWLEAHTLRFRSHLGDLPRRHIEEGLAEHLAMLSALKEGDPRKAQVWTEKHYDNAAHRTAELFTAARGT
jgi:DNA-binding GntR family transcriptional regulator